jgi:hypothetical protein
VAKPAAINGREREKRENNVLCGGSLPLFNLIELVISHNKRLTPKSLDTPCYTINSVKAKNLGPTPGVFPFLPSNKSNGETILAVNTLNSIFYSHL